MTIYRLLTGGSPQFNINKSINAARNKGYTFNGSCINSILQIIIIIIIIMSLYYYQLTIAVDLHEQQDAHDV